MIIAYCSSSVLFPVNLRLLDTYAAKTHENWPPLHVSLNNYVTRPSLKNLERNMERIRVIEANMQGGSDFHVYSSISIF